MAVVETHILRCGEAGVTSGFTVPLRMQDLSAGGVWCDFECEEGVREGRYVTQEQYQALVEQPDPFDAITGAGFFSFGLGVVVACWLVAHAAGLVVQSVRSF